MIGRVNTGGGTGAKLTATAPSGCTVTVSKDGKTKTKTAGADGVAVFKGLTTGQWTVNMTDGVHTAPARTADITVDYAITMSFFAATIHVTYPAGSTCTATDGVTTLTAPDTSGTWDCVVPNAGTWTVTVVDKGWADTANITDDGQTLSVYLDEYYLYRLGNEFTSRTGGWDSNNVAIANNVAVNALQITRNESDIVLVQNALQYGSCFSTNKSIDVTDYKTVFFDVSYSKSEAGAWSGFFVHQNRGSVRTGLGAFIETSTDSKIVGIDISKLSGNYYITAGLYSTGTLTVRKVWLE